LRLTYSILVVLLLPFVLAVLWLKGFGKNIVERLGRVEFTSTRPVIWLHAASVGEVNAAIPLINALREQYSGYQLLITTFTPTGAQRARELVRMEVPVHFLPLDAGFAVRRFLKQVRPKALLIMETEIWPQLLLECRAQEVPVLLASARLSEKSVKGYSRFSGLIADALSDVQVAAQTETDRQRFIDIGVKPDNIAVTGNLKLAFELPEGVAVSGKELREKHGAKRPVWVAASTHEGEEEKVLDAHRRLLDKLPDALLLLVPRHPQRFDGVAETVRKSGLSFIRHSSNQICDRRTQVLLCDTMGDLLMFYAASDIAFVGGSLVDVGGHNLLEPAALALPLLAGPHNYNAKDVADQLEAAHALTVVSNSEGLARSLAGLFANDRKRSRMGAAGLNATSELGGTLEKLLVCVTGLLK